MSAKWVSVFLYIIFSFSPDVLESQDCIDYGDYIRWVGGVDTPHEALEVAVSGNYAYVADKASGLQVIDITDPHSPTIVGSVDTPDNALGVAVSGSYVHVSDDASGLQVVGVRNPQSPVLLGSINTPGSANGVAFSGDFACVADWSSGLQVLPAQCDITSIDDVGSGTPSLLRALRLSQNYPNPFNPSTTISFDVPAMSGDRQRVKLVVYDIRGRRVRRLIDRSIEAGSHKVVWDGRGDRGERLASGIYFYRLRAGDKEFTRKMTILERVFVENPRRFS